jgi:hypothetical protein
LNDTGEIAYGFGLGVCATSGFTTGLLRRGTVVTPEGCSYSAGLPYGVDSRASGRTALIWGSGGSGGV